MYVYVIKYDFIWFHISFGVLDKRLFSQMFPVALKMDPVVSCISRGDETHPKCEPHLRLDVFQLRPAQRFTNAGGVISPSAMPSSLSHPQ